MNELYHYSLLAALFDFPEADYPQRVRQVKKYLDGNPKYSRASTQLDQFVTHLPVDNLLLMQELFTRSFDVQAIATLDIGYVLFGDDYKRGEMLAKLNGEHLKANNDCGTELADHLPNLLRLMDRLDDEELLSDLAYAIIAPALLDMVGEFSEQRLEKKQESFKKHYKTIIDAPKVQEQAVTLYKHALRAVYDVLREDFSLIEKIPLARENDFIESIGRENEIEDQNYSQDNAMQ